MGFNWIQHWIENAIEEEQAKKKAKYSNTDVNPAYGAKQDGTFRMADDSMDGYTPTVSANGEKLDPSVLQKYGATNLFPAPTAEEWQYNPELAQIKMRTNAENSSRPILAQNAEQIRAAIANTQFANAKNDFDAGRVSAYNTEGQPFSSSNIGKTVSSLAYNSKNGFEQNAATEFTQQLAAQNAARLASMRDQHSLGIGLPIDQNYADQSRALYSKKLNDANSTLVDPETSLRLSEINRQSNIQQNLYPIVDANNIFDAQTETQRQQDVRKSLLNTAKIQAGLTGQGVNDLGMDMDTMHTRSAMNSILGRIVGGEGSLLTSPFVQQLGEDGALHRSLNSAADGMTRLMGQAQEDAANKAGSKSGMQLPTGRTLNIPQYRAFGSKDGSPVTTSGKPSPKEQPISEQEIRKPFATNAFKTNFADPSVREKLISIDHEIEKLKKNLTAFKAVLSPQDAEVKKALNAKLYELEREKASYY